MLTNRSTLYLQRLHRRTALILVAVLLLFSIGSIKILNQPAPVFAAGSVVPTVETDPMPQAGDSADDPAIWIHPSDPAQSTIIATNKQGGIFVYNLAGDEIQRRTDGNMNNVDLRYNVPVGGQGIALVTATNRSDNSLALYKVNPATRQLEPIAARTIKPGIAAYGACMYRSPVSGRYYVFVTSSSGDVEQWELFDNGSGQVDAARVRSLSLSSTVEGCVVDDELARFYVSEETVGIWRFGAEPDAGADGTLIDTLTSASGLEADIEGLTLYYTSNRTGYLIASSQGNSSYAVYQREGDNTFIDRFVIGRNGSISPIIDAVQGTDGIDVTNAYLGPSFPQGVFIAQDDANDVGSQNLQNFKLVPWQSVAKAFDPDLVIDTSWDPRKVGATNPSPSPSPSPSPTPSASPSPSPSPSPSTPPPSPVPCTSPMPSPSPTPPPGGATRAFAPAADARVEEIAQNTNFGAHCILRTDGATTQRVESYLKFSVTGITRPVLSAKLRLFTITSSENGPGVYSSSTTWAENSITWNTAPGRLGDPLDNLGMTQANTWIEYDVTSAVDGDGTYSFVLAGSSSDGIQLSSREGSAQPQLVLTLAPGAYRAFIPMADARQ
ncbi:MAG: phytase [Chloroflexi bacterium]|nr:phytase [Chloroflexota bacterium]